VVYSTSTVNALSILDAAPKTSVKCLVGRDDELRVVVKSVLRHRITVVLGPRRIGKTSIVKTALVVLSGRERVEGIHINTKYIPIYIDMWGITAATQSSREFFEHLDNTILHVLSEHAPDILNEYRKSMHSVGEEIETRIGVEKFIAIGRSKKGRYGYPTFSVKCLDVLNDMLEKHGFKAVLAIDEAQELGSLKPFNPTMWLAHIHDHLTSIHVLLSGSYVGLMKKVLQPRQRDPLYGRDINRINVGKLSPVALIEILLRGLKERGVKPSDSFRETMNNLLLAFIGTDIVQHLPLSKKPPESDISTRIMLSRLSQLRQQLEEAIKSSERRTGQAIEWGTVLKLMVQFMVEAMAGLLHSFLVYYAANALMAIGFDTNVFSTMLPEAETQHLSPIANFLSRQGGKAFAILSLFILSGSPSLIINLVKKLPNNFSEEDLFRVGLEVLNDSYRAVCDEINRFIASYSKKPEIILTILYSLYSSPKNWSSLVEPLAQRGIDKKSVSENLKTLVELGYIAKMRIATNTYYYIVDPLLFYALKERCIGIEVS